MSRIGLVVGSALRGHEPEAEDGTIVLQRHGRDEYSPPHLIDHAANIRSLAERGCDSVLAISSVGSLRERIAAGSYLCPDDFIALQLGGSSFDDERGHALIGFDPSWRSQLISSWSRATEEPLADGGTYWQAIGPRFETPAEIRLIAPHAEVVGMTLASECVVAAELGLPFAAICAVDNLANGVGGRALTKTSYEEGSSANRARLREILPALLAELGEPG